MQPTSAPRYEYIAARTRRKWGELCGGELMVALDGVLGSFQFAEAPFRRAFGGEVYGAGAAEWLEALRLKADAIAMAGSVERKFI
jgi:hypothetical protein